MSGRGKLSKSLSTGIIVLVFFLLILQLGIFGVRIFQSYQINKEAMTAAADTLRGANSASVANSTSAAHSNYTTHSNSTGDSKPTANPNSSARSKPAANQTSSARSKPSASSKKVPEKRVFALAPLPPKPAYKPKPKVDINKADTTELMTLYGIGSYYARRIVEFREELGGSYASLEQLMDIKGIDSARFVGFENRICIDSSLVRRIDFYTYPLDSLSIHPYIGKYAAKGVDRLRRTVSPSQFTIDALVENGIISAPQGQRLKLYEK